MTGGRETYARELLRALAGRVRLTAFVNRETAEAGAGWWTDTTDRAVVLPAASARARARWAAGEVVGVARAAARAGVDVLHSPANFGPVAGPFARVLTLHDLAFRIRPETVSTPARYATDLLVRAAARRAHRIITGSATAREELVREFGLPASRIEVVPHGVAAPRPAPPADLGDAPVVLSVATNLPHKDLPTAVEAVRRVDGARLVLAGAGTEVLGGLGAVPDLEALYARADVLLITSLHEGFGLTVIEALRREVPVVCTDLPVLREVAGGHAEVFPAGDAAAAARAIKRALAAGPGADGRRYAEGFSWTGAAEATLGVYEAAQRLRRTGGRGRT